MRPVLNYGSSVWEPPGVVLQEELESVQKCAAIFVTGNYNYETGSMTGILGQKSASMTFQTPIANTDGYKGGFFPQTIRDWNGLPNSLISFAEDAEDCVAKFTSLLRARD